MRNKAPLMLMEQLVMVLVFALAAALCLQAFALSDRLSRQSEARDAAVVLAQNEAERLKADRTPVQPYQRRYDQRWNETEDAGAYCLSVMPLASDVPGLCRAQVTVSRGQTQLFSLTAAWQEVTP